MAIVGCCRSAVTAIRNVLSKPPSRSRALLAAFVSALHGMQKRRPWLLLLRPNPVCDCRTDLVWGVFLNEVNAFDSQLGQVRPRAHGG